MMGSRFLVLSFHGGLSSFHGYEMLIDINDFHRWP